MSKDKIVLQLAGMEIGRIGVLGLGRSGLSCLDYLVGFDVDVDAFDSQLSPSQLVLFQGQYPSVKFQSGDLDERILDVLDALVISPGVDPRVSAVEKAAHSGVSILGDMELYCLASNVPRIAITGSNAKTTVTTLVGEMVKKKFPDAQVAGNIGVPVLTLLQLEEDKSRSSGRGFDVLELSSFQLETTKSLQAEVAAILNITPDHMDRYASFDDYVQVKQKIYHKAKSVIWNRKDARTFPAEMPNAKQLIYSFGLDEPSNPKSAGVVQGKITFGGEEVLAVADLQLQGLHDIENALAAVAIASAVGIPRDTIAEVLIEFKGLPHRCQWVRNLHGVNWFNDSKGTNVGATIAAVEGLGEVNKQVLPSIVLIMGGVAKGAEFVSLSQPINRYVKSVILIGEAAGYIEQQLSEHSVVCIVRANSLLEAVTLANSKVKKGDVVLFSPACASFDMFENYEDRGSQYMALVNGLSDESLTRVFE